MTNTNNALPLLLEPEALQRLLEEEKLPENTCIVDLSAESNYMHGHIEGAIYLPFQALISPRPPAQAVLPPISQLEKVFTYLNFSPDTHFIVCDDEGGGWAGRFIWTLEMIGHTRYSYLNGGMVAWKNEERPTVSTPSSANSNSNPVSLSIHPQALCSADDIMQSLGRDDFVIWDARSSAEYNGQRMTAAKSGHIPGAVNAEWTSLMDPQRNLRIREDAAEYLAKLGITSEKAVVTHCQSHHRSGFTYMVGIILGLNIRAYDGSWSEWGNLPNTPVER